MFIRFLLPFVALGLFSSVLSAKTISITIHPVIEKMVEERIETVGQVETLQSPVVAAELTAKVIDIQVKIGDEVTTETILAKLDSATYDLQLAEAQAELRRLDAMVKLQKRQVKRYKALLRKKGIDRSTYDKSVSEKDSVVSQQEYAQAKVQAAELRVKQTEIISPIEGVVDERMVSVGSYVVPGKPLFRVVGVEQLRVRLPFSERRYSDIRKGQTVYLTSAVSAGSPIKAQIDYLRPQIEANSRAIEVFASFENEQAWLPGASVNAELVLQQQQNALVVPVQSIVDRPVGQVVYVVHSDEKSQQVSIEERPVSTGLMSDKGVQVLSGLNLGENIAVDGARFLSAGADVEIQR
ncbi:MAG: efflux RND transporter periplasmic adaptor subunit [Pseudomonadota bacterium]|nr:efflux RND transporter periplasmic adaptor subunit [Pseudomonadota bacterium]